MLKSKWNMVLVLLACALLLPVTMSCKYPLKLPFAIQGNGKVQMLGGGQTQVSETGIATYIGKYSAIGNGVFSDATHGHYAKSVYTAANGDELWFTGDVSVISFTTDKCTFTMNFKIIGGTGCFDGAVGDLNPVTVTGDFDPVAGKITYSYCNKGTITF